MSFAPTDEDLQRYSRQLLMPEFDVAGQQRLAESRVLVVGAGGLGCPVVLYLAAAGVGRIRVADPDHVDLTNLQRQIAFTMTDLERPKAEVLAERAAQTNPRIQIDALVTRLEGDALDAEVAAADLVLDASDNFATRFAVNRSCVRHGRPLVSGAAIRAEGQVSVFAAGPETPCYACLYDSNSDEPALTCFESGVLGPLVGLIGATQALEAMKLLAGIGQSLAGRLLILDGLAMQWREMRLPRDPACPVCGDEVRR